MLAIVAEAALRMMWPVPLNPFARDLVIKAAGAMGGGRGLSVMLR